MIEKIIIWGLLIFTSFLVLILWVIAAWVSWSVSPWWLVVVPFLAIVTWRQVAYIQEASEL